MKLNYSIRLKIIGNVISRKFQLEFLIKQQQQKIRLFALDFCEAIVDEAEIRPWAASTVTSYRNLELISSLLNSKQLQNQSDSRISNFRLQYQ